MMNRGLPNNILLLARSKLFTIARWHYLFFLKLGNIPKSGCRLNSAKPKYRFAKAQ
jgi:hypothetical protein